MIIQKNRIGSLGLFFASIIALVFGCGCNEVKPKRKARLNGLYEMKDFQVRTGLEVTNYQTMLSIRESGLIDFPIRFNPMFPDTVKSKWEMKEGNSLQLPLEQNTPITIFVISADSTLNGEWKLSNIQIQKSSQIDPLISHATLSNRHYSMECRLAMGL